MGALAIMKRCKTTLHLLFNSYHKSSKKPAPPNNPRKIPGATPEHIRKLLTNNVVTTELV